MRYSSFVALLAEGVDRNLINAQIFCPVDRSPSSRRAWIEISPPPGVVTVTLVSPSSRRAWIEMLLNRYPSFTTPVALLAEGVDRNCLLVDDLVKR